MERCTTGWRRRGALCLLMAGAFLESAVAQAPSAGSAAAPAPFGELFAVRGIRTTGSIVTVQAADLDGDGREEILALTSAPAQVRGWSPDGHGTYRPLAPISTETGASDLATGDLDGDGATDLIVTHSGADTVAVHLGNGSGGFLPMFTLAVGAGPAAVVLGDVDGDGALDIITADDAAGTATVLRNTGGATFATGVSHAVGTSARDLVLGDVTSDGAVDLVVADTLSGEIVLLDGIALPGGPTRHVTASSQSTTLALRAAGTLDVAVLAAGAQFLDDVALLRWSPAAGTLVETPIAMTTPIREILSTDFDGDAEEDLVGTSPDARLLIRLGLQGGGFDAPLSIPTTFAVRGLWTADVDGDGTGRLVVGGGGLLAIHASAPDGLPLGNRVVMDEHTAETIRAADMNEDGRPDAVVGVWEKGLWFVGVYPRTPAGSFVMTDQVGVRATGLAVHDENGDGHLDVLACAEGTAVDGVATVHGLGNGKLGATQVTVLQPGPSLLVEADLDGHPPLDLVVGGLYSPGLSALLDVPEAGLQHTWRIAPPAAIRDLAAADLDGDGHTDVIAVDAGETLRWWEGQGDGTFGDEHRLRIPGAADRVAAGDLDGDGNVDLVTTFLQTDSISIRWGGENGEFPVLQQLPDSVWNRKVALADVDGDGRLDVLAGGGYGLSVHRNRGDRRFGREERYVARGAEDLEAFDADGDGDLDLWTVGWGAEIAVNRSGDP